EQFKGRQHSPLVQFIKYGIAGVIATSVHIGLFYLSAYFLLSALSNSDPVVSHLHLSVPLISDQVRARNYCIDYGFAFIFSNMVAYLINIKGVFESGRHKRWVEIGIFYAVSGLSSGISIALTGFLIDHYGMITTYAFGISILVSLMINFVLRKFVIFKK